MNATGFRQKSVKILYQRPHANGEESCTISWVSMGYSPLKEILKREIKEYALEKGFDIKTLIEYTAMNTVIIKEMDNIVDEYDIGEIKENIESVNSWAKVDL